MLRETAMWPNHADAANPKEIMNLFQQLNAAAGRPQQALPHNYNLYHQLTLAAIHAKPRHSNKREIADAAWAKAFNGKDLTAPELARIRHLQVEGMFTTLKRLEGRGVVIRVGDRASTGTRRITLWRWVGETEE